ncbi:trp operon leader peptide [Streptomyces mobaraensis NBRC 13819 = DSM 40847]|uniref:Trp operon leader peptide n=1 Tax=Streptomyces mobaraensis TaxID=35621 RepID=A0A5N5W5P1_STRMB|nr:trp operon leader peptide [Streptomyces mobaraensis]QTT73430.1 trp operon leader peptide [Streptomyces mobaraensis NBRC 13819 = DSM 40847]
MRAPVHPDDRTLRRRTPPSGKPCGKVRRMYAHSNQNWWWTAHPAAH